MEEPLSLHEKITGKLRQGPYLWQIPHENLSKWKAYKGYLSPPLHEWESILQTKTQEQILALPESDSEEAIINDLQILKRHSLSTPI